MSLSKEQIAKASIIRTMISGANGSIVGITFTKKDGSERTMAFRTGVVHSKLSGDVKGTMPDATAKRKVTLGENGMMGVHDQSNGYRTINLVTASRVRIKGTSILFPKD